jgi:alcohol dehydrogenase
MREIVLRQPPVTRFGAGCRAALTEYLSQVGLRSIHFLCSPSLEKHARELAGATEKTGRRATLQVVATGEPTVTSFEQSLRKAAKASPDVVIGVGGGSVLDVAKLVSAFVDSPKRIDECFGIGLLPNRSLHLICLPTTAGTGSEVSPNAILLDEKDTLKKGVISPYLVPDATFIDPELSIGVPPEVTAFTGLDTLTHCIEAYTNRFAHPLIDMYALEGIRLTVKFLPRAVRDGNDLEAREAMAMASYLGGLCLGPVNTAAVHALSYPLGSRYHVAHGLSNAMLLCAVMRFNLIATPDRYAVIARSLGAHEGSSSSDTAEAGISILEDLVRQCGAEKHLSEFGIIESDIPEMAKAAATVTRLLKNNPRDISIAEIQSIYRSIF